MDFFSCGVCESSSRESGHKRLLQKVVQWYVPSHVWISAVSAACLPSAA